jgi:hypothetical protein
MATLTDPVEMTATRSLQRLLLHSQPPTLQPGLSGTWERKRALDGAGVLGLAVASV